MHRSPARLAPVTVHGLTAALWGASLASVAGTLLLIHFPEVTTFLGRSLTWFIKVPTLVYLIALPALVWVLLREEVGSRKAGVMLLWGSGVGLAAELAGTTTGWPFGVYRYTEFLAPQILGHVPLYVPLSWFAMSVAAAWLAATVTRHPVLRVVFAASAMVGWDLALDPAMVAGWPVWVWSDPDGIYYGMPLLNLAGWWVTSAIIVGGFLLMGDVDTRVERRSRHLWLLSAVLPLGLIAVRGMWPAAVLGSAGVALPVVASWLANRRAVRVIAPRAPAASSARP